MSANTSSKVPNVTSIFGEPNVPSASIFVALICGNEKYLFALPYTVTIWVIFKYSYSGL